MSGDIMTFPKTVDEFMERYKITDTEHVYTNGAELVPVFRMKQWFEHIEAEPIRHGKWEYDVETAGFKCTECGKRIWGMTLEIASGDINYCPKCGAKMDG